MPVSIASEIEFSILQNKQYQNLENDRIVQPICVYDC